MVACWLPFHVVEHIQFWRVLTMAASSVNLPNWHDIWNHLMDLFKITHSKALEALPFDGKISLALDCWTSQDQKPFLAIVGYFVSKEYKFYKVLLGFWHIKGSHEGAHLADIVIDILNEYNLCSYVLAITTDNTSNNQTLMGAVVGRLNNSFNPNHPLVDQPYYLPCLAHVI